MVSGGAASELYVTRLQDSEKTLIGEMDSRLHIPAVHRPNEEGRHLSPKET
jgi:hypothetical protein